MSSRMLACTLASLTVVSVPHLSGAGQMQSLDSPVNGEYIVTRNNVEDCAPRVAACSFCATFAQNLNEFRASEFDACEPRLSERYPEFSRPVWEEIPLELRLAEMIIMNLVRRPPGHGDPHWTRWLKASAALRAAGRITLWRTRVDIDGDGVSETILRLYAPLNIEYRQGQEHWVLEPHPCIYRHSAFYMLESPKAQTKESFNRGALDIGDIIIRRSPGRPDEYHALGRLVVPVRAPDGQRVAREMKAYWLTAYGAGRLCALHWIPTGHSLPATRMP